MKQNPVEKSNIKEKGRSPNPHKVQTQVQIIYYSRKLYNNHISRKSLNHSLRPTSSQPLLLRKLWVNGRSIRSVKMTLIRQTLFRGKCCPLCSHPIVNAAILLLELHMFFPIFLQNMWVRNIISLNP